MLASMAALSVKLPLVSSSRRRYTAIARSDETLATSPFARRGARREKPRFSRTRIAVALPPMRAVGSMRTQIALPPSMAPSRGAETTMPSAGTPSATSAATTSSSTLPNEPGRAALQSLPIGLAWSLSATPPSGSALHRSPTSAAHASDATAPAPSGTATCHDRSKNCREWLFSAPTPRIHRTPHMYRA